MTRDHYQIASKCGNPTCDTKGEIKVPVRQGQPFVAVPPLWCVKCAPAVPMDHEAPAKVVPSLISVPTTVPPPGLKVERK